MYHQKFRVAFFLGLLGCFCLAGGAEKVPKVLAKLHPDVCQPSGSATHVFPQAMFIKVKAQAEAVGLKYHSELPVPCWHVLQPAATRAATQAAIRALLATETASAASLSAGTSAGSSALFAIALLDRAIQLPVNEYSIQQQQVAAAAAGTRVPAELPAECSSSCPVWGLNRIRAPELWQDLAQEFPFPNITRGATIIDTGTDFSNYNIIPQVDLNTSATFAQGEANPPPGGAAGNPHGTHVFGIAAAGWGPYAGQNDPKGIVGVMGPAYNQIVSCNTFGSDIDAWDSDICRCLAHAAAVDAHWVVNLSLGGDDTRNSPLDQLYRDAFQQFCDAGGIAVVAAGNGRCINTWQNGTYDECRRSPGWATYIGVDIADAGLEPNGTMTPGIASYPAIMAEYFPDCVIAVASLGPDDTLARYSNWGPSVRLAAPGENILSTTVVRRNDSWSSVVMSGSSMATPYVAGAAILLRNAFPQANNSQVVRCLISSADMTVKPARPNATINGGVLNVRAAYECLAGKPLFTCRDEPVPPCVDAASGVQATNCTGTAYFCLPVLVNNTMNGTGNVNDTWNETVPSGNATLAGFDYTVSSNINNTYGSGLICRYNFKGNTSVCDTEYNVTCDGLSPECAAPSQIVGVECSDPPVLNDTAFYDLECVTNATVGTTCKATCTEGFTGDGYKVDCLPNGGWKLYGEGCVVMPKALEVCGACTRPGMCTEREGCRCVEKVRASNNTIYGNSSRGGGIRNLAPNNTCTCPAIRGLIERSYQQQGTLVSQCAWNIKFPWASKVGFLSVPLNTTVVLNYTIGSPAVCPSGARKVISRELVIGARVACPATATAVAVPLFRVEPVALRGESCDQRIKTLSYILNTTRAFSTVMGHCYRLPIFLTDGSVYSAIVVYT